MKTPPRFTVKQLEDAINREGSICAAARRLKMDESTIRERLGRRGKRTSFRRPLEAPPPQATGQVHYRKPEVRELPAEGETKVYIVTAAQVCTEVHAAFWTNLKAYARARKAEILVSTPTYDQRQYSRPDQIKSRAEVEADVERGVTKRERAVWIADQVRPHLSNSRVKLAPTLQWCGELNILPTAARPLNGLSGYTGQDSCIVPHTKLALESVPTGRYEPTKFLYSTGACTLRNYIQKRVGQVAEFHHAYAALVVEVLSDGRWFVRQLNATSDGAFQDLTALVKDGRLFHARVAGIQWGDIHASAMDQDVRELCWGLCRAGQVSVIDALQPSVQFFHDLIDFHSANHHERKSPRKRFERWARKQNDVRAEIDATCAFLVGAARPWCEGIIVPSNHDEHADRWLDEGDPLADPQNSALWHRANGAMRDSIANGDDWSFAAWAFADSPARVLKRDEPYVLHEIEMGWHGDLGPNGARGSTQGLIKTCRRISKGHDHQATIRDGVYSAGVCARTLDYARGPSSWSISHIVVYPNGKRCILTQNGDAYWAPRKEKKAGKACPTKKAPRSAPARSAKTGSISKSVTRSRSISAGAT